MTDSSNPKRRSGEQEKFWDHHYKQGRYVNADGTTVPLYDQVLIEEGLRAVRFEPGRDGVKLRKGDLPF
jgi:hypothetical protein